MNIFKSISGNTQNGNLASILKEPGTFLVDVRSPEEFEDSPIPGAVNIPLERVQSQAERFKGKKHIVVYCRSGNRSGIAKSILERLGISGVINGGSWQNVYQNLK